MANPWDNDPIVGAPTAAPQPMTVGTPSPMKTRELQLREEANSRAEEDQQFQRAEAARKAAKPEGELGVAQSKAAGFLSRAEKANQAYEQTGVGAQSLGTAVARAVTPDVAEPYVIGPQRQEAEANIRAFISSVLRYESGAAIPPEEFDSANKTYFPQAGEAPETVAAKARLRAQAIEAIRLGAGKPPADAQPVVHDANLGGEAIAPSTNGTRTVDNPKLAGVRGEYLSRLEQGQSASEIVAFLQRAGIKDPKVLRSAVEQAKFRKANPQVPIDKFNTSALDDMDVPLSGVEQSMNAAAQTAPGAYLMQAGNAVTGNNLDSIIGAVGGNDERARLALDYAGQEHPTASLAGNLSGGVMAAMGGEAALARGGMAAGLGRSVVADTAYGASAGAGGADGGDRVTGALYGAGAGLAGSVGGNALMKGVGSVVSPTGGNLNALYSAGVRPTPGQRLVSAGDGKGVRGLVGRAINSAEEGISSVPIIGSAIRGARQDARDQFQIGAFNEALKEVGAKLPKDMKPGTKPHEFATRIFDNAYNKARQGMKLAADEELANDVGGLGEQIATLAEPSAKRFNSILQNVVMRRIGPDGTIAGDAYKKVQAEIGRITRSIRKSQSGDGELAEVLEELGSVLDGAARRHSDPKAVKLLDKADRGYAKFVRIRDAAKARGGDAGTFTPTQFDRSVQSNARGRRSEEYLRGDALMQEYAEQGMSLVDRLPNSGTADRAMMGLGAAGAAGYIEPGSLSLLGALGLAYAPGIRKATTGAMAPRGAKATALANNVRGKAKIAGHIGGSQAALSRD